ncbi:type II toxin-antitoxin system HicA family toxin [Spirosoma sp. SC4-14]|uniref:type II toxin-antitoxin system HicA family toxin n=1 Tax=Spirosoma sp. SC4-14 TaxID=3128900 RepID=UPI0030D1F457
MKTTVLSGLLQEKGWRIVEQHTHHCLFGHSIKNHAVSFIIPVASTENIPNGTLNAVLRSISKVGSNSHWTTSITQSKSHNVVLEKQGKSIWGRLETQSLLATTRGCSVEDVMARLKLLLIDTATDGHICYRSIFESIVFEPVYDTTAVWDLFRQLKANQIAGDAGIDMESISRFMSGATFPSVEQAARLEASIHALGRQLMQLSIR